MDRNPINLGDEHHDNSWVMQKIYESSQLGFNAITKNVKLSFAHLVDLIRKHDVDKILKKEVLKTNEEDRERIVISGSLLVELADCPPAKEKKSTNLLSGVFLIGFLMGCIGAIAIAMVLINSKVEITQELLMYTGIGFLVALLLVIGIPLFLAFIEPQLKRVQEAHHDFVDRFLGMFQ